MNQNEVMKRYYKEFFISMAAYVIVLMASVLVLNNIEMPQAAKIVVALLPVIPTVFVIVAIMRALQGSDELQQKVQLYAITFSAIMTGLITFSYGFLEGIGFPPFPSIWILPIMFFLWGISLGYFWRKYQ